MSIKHIFYQVQFDDLFATNNTILDVIPYDPEILILGTFNPATPNYNFADFFYGRNFFWTAFKNLFIINQIELRSRRMPTRGIPNPNLNPSRNEILQICSRLKLTFSDLIFQVLNDEIIYEILPNDNIIYNGNEYNLIQDNKKGNVLGLQELNNLNLVNWNTDNIINYLIQNPKIRTIYFTRQPNGVWGVEWNKIKNNELLSDRNFTNLYTPSGAGKPVFYSMERLTNHWLFNTNEINFGKLDENWLIRNGVDPNNFS